MAGLRAVLNVRSLSDTFEPEYYEARTVQAAVDDEPFQEVFDEERSKRTGATALECLNPRQRRLLRLRYGIEGDPQTLGQISQVEGITRERVRQILVVAERKLRSFIQRKLSDLIPSGAVGPPHAPTVNREGIDIDVPDAEEIEEIASLIDALVSSGVAVLSEEELELAGLKVECDKKAMDHVTDAVGRQIAFHEEAVVNLQGLQ